MKKRKNMAKLRLTVEEAIDGAWEGFGEEREFRWDLILMSGLWAEIGGHNKRDYMQRELDV